MNGVCKHTLLQFVKIDGVLTHTLPTKGKTQNLTQDYHRQFCNIATENYHLQPGGNKPNNHLVVYGLTLLHLFMKEKYEMS